MGVDLATILKEAILWLRLWSSKDSANLMCGLIAKKMASLCALFLY